MPDHSGAPRPSARRHRDGVYGRPFHHAGRVGIRLRARCALVSVAGRGLDCGFHRIHGDRKYCRGPARAALAGGVWFRPRARLRLFVRVARFAAVCRRPSVDGVGVVQCGHRDRTAAGVVGRGAGARVDLPASGRRAHGQRRGVGADCTYGMALDDRTVRRAAHLSVQYTGDGYRIRHWDAAIGDGALDRWRRRLGHVRDHGTPGVTRDCESRASRHRAADSRLWRGVPDRASAGGACAIAHDDDRRLYRRAGEEGKGSIHGRVQRLPHRRVAQRSGVRGTMDGKTAVGILRLRGAPDAERQPRRAQ